MGSEQLNTGHLERREYRSVRAALTDAERVLEDLVIAVGDSEALFADPQRLVFLARRGRDLVVKSREAAEKAVL